MNVHRRTVAWLAAVAMLAAVAGVAPLGAAEHTKTDTVVTSHDGTPIAVTVFKPATAGADTPVPMIMHSHGWGGSRTTAISAFQAELDEGFGVLSFDQRGFGQTPGPANVQDPELEGRDVIALIDFIAGLDWVAKDVKPGVPANAAETAKGNTGHVGVREDAEVDPSDPVLFAMGLSYGGGYQFIGALTETRETGRTRFNALAPEITWFDLADSLAPAKVARTAWISLLYATGLQAHRQDIHAATAFGMATGQWPDGTYPGIANIHDRFRANSPVAFVEDGKHLDVPVLIGQGSSDNLFNLNQGVRNFEITLTDAARAKSLFVGYNGGHALPNVLPPGYPADVQVGGNADPCSQPAGGFGKLRRDFFRAVIAGENPRALLGAGQAYHVATADGVCVHTDSVAANTELVAAAAPGLPSAAVTTTGAGAPQHLHLAAGPLRVAGVPVLEADVTTVGADQRVFFGLSVGETPATARVVHNNLLPLRELLPIVREGRVLELAGMAVDVPAGQHLYLTVSPLSDMYFGHGSTRTPGAVTLENIRVRVPVQP
ncbi:MAG TPA: CocE/NonD family hydrolase [Egibacteraceae bacterium]|nr:CocE/NonD family hydrolase [Egibacteraceae bacterium]